MKVTAAIIVSDQKILIAKRNSSKSLPNVWEFPGGKVEENESPETCVVREIKEELNLTIHVIRHFSMIDHPYDFGDITLIVFLAEVEGGKLEFNEHADARWVTIEELDDFVFAPADIPAIKQLQKEGMKT